MSDNDLNKAIVEKVMGIRVDPNGCMCVDCIVGEAINEWLVPDYANDIAAAFTIAEKLKIAIRPAPDEDSTEWYAGQMIQLDDGIGTWIVVSWVKADTAAKAICLVATQEPVN